MRAQKGKKRAVEKAFIFFKKRHIVMNKMLLEIAIKMLSVFKMGMRNKLLELGEEVSFIKWLNCALLSSKQTF